MKQNPRKLLVKWQGKCFKKEENAKEIILTTDSSSSEEGPTIKKLSQH